MEMRCILAECNIKKFEVYINKAAAIYLSCIH